MASHDFDPVGRAKAKRHEYYLLHRRGERRPVTRQSLEARFVPKVDRLYGFAPEHRPELEECWPWLGATNTDGYGIIRGDRELDPETGKPRWPLLLAHRVALSLALDRPIRDGLLSNHRCDNPPCCRPRHLYEGTRQDNIDDMIASGRYNGFAILRPILRTRVG